MAVVGYCRVSTGGQSLEVQLQQLSDQKVDKLFKEKITASKWNRPEMQKLIDYVRENDVVIVTKLDRIARNTRDLLRLIDIFKEKKVQFKVLNMNLDTSTATGKMMITVMAAVAEFERGLLLERQAEGIALAKLKGKYKGRRPKVREQATTIFRMVRDGKSKTQVAKELGFSLRALHATYTDARNGKNGLTPNMI